MGAFYCSVCRQTFFRGKAHIFGKSHQAKLKVILVKFLEKVKEARRTVRSPQVEKFDATEHERNLWCYCCGVEVQKHVTNGNVAVLYGGLLEHMATQDHRKNTHRFWWENKVDQKLKEKFLISAEESERFKAEVEKALEGYEEKEDVLLKQQADIIRAQEQQRKDFLQSLAEQLQQQSEVSAKVQNGPEELATSCTFRLPDPAEEPGPSWMDPIDQSDWSELTSGLTFIGYQDSSLEGNVHTGAVPPWLQNNPLEGGREIGPSLQDFQKHKEQEKLKKLPPNRVGANFNHNLQTDASWLPSFGRVWNSGRRWQSRQQFRAEEAQAGRFKRRRGDDPAQTGKRPKEKDEP